MVRTADLTAAIGETIDPMRLMQRVTDRTLELISAANGVMVGLADEDGVTYVCGGGNQIGGVGTRVDLFSSLSGLTARTGVLQRSDDTTTDPRVDAAACRRLSVVSLVCVPLSRGFETLGVLAVNAAQPKAFTERDIATLTELADFVSVVVGSACDLGRVKAQLLGMSEPGRSAAPAETFAALPTPRSTDATNRYVMSVLDPDSVGRIDSSQRIQAILDDPDNMTMVFQPIIDLADDEVAAVEALARFESTPYRSPDMWFADAHNSGLGVELETLAITRALNQLPRLPDSVTLTINAGPQSVMCEEFREAVLAAPCRRLILELTEHTVVDDYPALVAALKSMRQRGARIAIDDTGSGYSSLAHILKLAPDFIKLDHDLVSGIDVDPVRRALAASLVSFAAETGAQIIAEGVESSEELEVLRGLGVRYAQGYHLGRPGSLEALADLDHPAGRAASVAAR
ncbi:MAG TPA: EAL domain-containing protein [Mycobacteriales bacterium]|jgi:EAL domain-containing protein (putative c-di-GMP-specific phosphodiesterase class I)|nr:EAL domain-containing protein [Mycobacteriales bacterium]